MYQTETCVYVHQKQSRMFTATVSALVPKMETTQTPVKAEQINKGLLEQWDTIRSQHEVQND